MIQYPLTLIPSAIMRFFNTLISIRRVERFLAEPDLPKLPSMTSTSTTDLGFVNASLIWPPPLHFDKPLNDFSLLIPSFTFPKHSMTLVTGPTASGKSSFLIALLGELDCISGQLLRPTVPGAIAYAGQTSWLEPDTIRNNITFGTPLDMHRLEAVLEACALKPDMAEFPAADLTGEPKHAKE